jgi:hypothetical protein
MNIKLKALLLTGVFFAVSVGCAMAIEWFFTSFTAEQIGFAAQCLLVSLLAYAVYGLILARLEMDKSLDKLKDIL